MAKSHSCRTLRLAMHPADLLDRIQATWAQRVLNALAREQLVREYFIPELARFFNSLKHVVETGDAAWLEPVYDEWIASRSRLEQLNNQSSIFPVIFQLFDLLMTVSKELLGDCEALILIAALYPHFAHSIRYCTVKENQLDIQHLTAEVERTRISLERLDRSKSDFIAVAAHELKTPLTLIEGYTSMLAETLNESDQNIKRDAYLKGIGNGTRRLREIIDDMIDVSLIDNQLLSLHFQPVWMFRLLKSLKDEYNDVLIERQLSFKLDKFDGDREMTFGDEQRLLQAFRNIFQNSIKFTPNGGLIKISGRKLPGFIEILFEDTGIGVDPEDHLLIFEKFHRLGAAQLHSSGKTKFKGGGPGLGLPIAKGIIEAHGGTVWVESQGYDEKTCPGTTVHVLLPMIKEPPDKKAARLFRPFSGSEK